MSQQRQTYGEENARAKRFADQYGLSSEARKALERLLAEYGDARFEDGRALAEKRGGV